MNSITLTATQKQSLRAALIAFLSGRLFYSLWAIVIIRLVPAPLTPDSLLRPYQGQPALLEGLSGMLLGPWQRFDTMHYLRIAQSGYEVVNSVFPPLYPLLIRAVDAVLAVLIPSAPAVTAMIAALIVSNLALIGALALLHYLTAQLLDQAAAARTLAYLIAFPTGFFLFAGYSESLFVLCAVGAIFFALRDAPMRAGLLGLLAALTRLTGCVLAAPLAVAYARQKGRGWRDAAWHGVGVLLPFAGILGFLLWREVVGLPPINDVYEQFWFRSTRAPGSDLLLALRSLMIGEGPRANEISLALDVLATAFLMVTTVLVFRRLGFILGLTNLALFVFLLLPTSDVKPLQAFSRYVLAFFPSFMALGAMGGRPWLHRIILYGSLLLTLFFSGQFFIWGWVA